MTGVRYSAAILLIIFMVFLSYFLTSCSRVLLEQLTGS